MPINGPPMTQKQVRDALDYCKVFPEGHFVLASGKHAAVYFDKHALFPHTLHVSILCRELARRFRDTGIEIVVGPEKGGILLSFEVARHLTDWTGAVVLSIYAEKKGDEFAFRYGRERFVAGKRALVVEDALTTGKTVGKVVQLVRSVDGDVAGVGAILNRGNVQPSDVGDVPNLQALLTLKLDAWKPTSCPLCQEGVPINIDLGHGADYLESLAQ